MIYNLTNEELIYLIETLNIFKNDLNNELSGKLTTTIDTSFGLMQLTVSIPEELKEKNPHVGKQHQLLNSITDKLNATREILKEDPDFNDTLESIYPADLFFFNEADDDDSEEENL